MSSRPAIVRTNANRFGNRSGRNGNHGNQGGNQGNQGGGGGGGGLLSRRLQRRAGRQGNNDDDISDNRRGGNNSRNQGGGGFRSGNQGSSGSSQGGDHGNNQGGGGGGKAHGQGGRTLLHIPNLVNVDQGKLFQLLRKNNPFSYSGYREAENGVYFMVENKDVTRVIAKGNIKIKDQKYRVIKANLDTPSYTAAQNEALKRSLEARYAAPNNFLNLAGLIDDQDLRAQGIVPDLKQRAFASALIALMKAHIPNVETIDFTGNRLESLAPLKNLHVDLPNVKNLNFHNNGIKALREFDNLIGFKNISELIITANTVCDNSTDAVITRELSSLFPKLKTLNGAAVRSFTVANDEADSGLKPVKGNFVDPRVGQVVEQFFTNFFAQYDADRSLLGPMYHASAKFSHYITKDQRNPDGYYNGNRNLHQVAASGIDKRVSLLSVGRSTVVSKLVSLPASKHVFSSFVYDTWEDSVAEGISVLIVCLNGTFEEGQGIRSFSRTFLLIPASDGSEAKARGFLTEIIADQLRITGYERSERPAQQRASTSAATTTYGSTSQLPTLPSILVAPSGTTTQPDIASLVATVMGKTRLKDFAAAELLRMSGYNLEAALQQFEAFVRTNNIPPTSYQ